MNIDSQECIDRLRMKSFMNINSMSNEYSVILFAICKPYNQLLSWSNEYRKLYFCKWPLRPDLNITDIAFTEDLKVVITAGKYYYIVIIQPNRYIVCYTIIPSFLPKYFYYYRKW